MPLGQPDWKAHTSATKMPRGDTYLQCSLQDHLAAFTPACCHRECHFPKAHPTSSPRKSTKAQHGFSDIWMKITWMLHQATDGSWFTGGALGIPYERGILSKPEKPQPPSQATIDWYTNSCFWSTAWYTQIRRTRCRIFDDKPSSC